MTTLAAVFPTLTAGRAHLWRGPLHRALCGRPIAPLIRGVVMQTTNCCPTCLERAKALGLCCATCGLPLVDQGLQRPTHCRACGRQAAQEAAGV